MNATATHPRDVHLSQFALPSLHTSGVIALALYLLLMLFIVTFIWWFESLRVVAMGVVAIGVAVWWIAAFLYMVWVLPAHERKTLRARGVEYSINARSHPRLKTLLQRGSANVGVREPQGYIQKISRKSSSQKTALDKVKAHYDVRIAGMSPHWIVVGQGALENLEPPELDCLALRCLVHARLGNVSRLDTVRRLAQMSFIHRVLVWPIGLYAALLRALWLPHAEASADRLTLLLVKNPKLVMSALLKDFVAHHGVLRARDVGFSDVEMYLKDLKGSALAKQGSAMSAQHALTSALHDDASFNARLTAITAWVNSPEYVSALEQLAQD